MASPQDNMAKQQNWETWVPKTSGIDYDVHFHVSFGYITHETLKI